MCIRNNKEINTLEMTCWKKQIVSSGWNTNRTKRADLGGVLVSMWVERSPPKVATFLDMELIASGGGRVWTSKIK